MGTHDGHRSRLRQRFLRYGLDGFDDHNILELLLCYAQPRRDMNETAHRLIDTFGSLDAVFEATPEELMKVEGISEYSATLIRLVPAAARRYQMAKQAAGTILRDSQSAGKFMVPRFFGFREEHVFLACLDSKLRLIDCRRLSTGGTSAAPLDVRLVAQTALSLNASAVILAHNHPNGIPRPSEEDIAVTRQAAEALALVGVSLLDHIVVAGDSFVSLADEGYMRRE